MTKIPDLSFPPWSLPRLEGATVVGSLGKHDGGGFSKIRPISVFLTVELQELAFQNGS